MEMAPWGCINLPVDLSSALLIQPTRAAIPSAPAAAKHATRDAAEEFEAFVLQSFIGEMLPKSADHVFGRGIAGDIWKSLLSEKLAYEVARRGDLGIAEQVRGSGGIESLRRVHEASRLSGVSALALSGQPLLDHSVPFDEAGPVQSATGLGAALRG
jgi:hypothetical protein